MKILKNDLLFDTWDGDQTTLREDLQRVIDKHISGAVPGVSSDKLAHLVEETIDAVIHADGNSSEFVTSAFMAYKHYRKD